MGPGIYSKDQDGDGITQSQFKGKKLVLYVYPKGSTLRCTTEACNLMDNYERFMSQGYAVVGLSTQNEESHMKFISKYNRTSPLIAAT